jgi:hypothetical protein
VAELNTAPRSRFVSVIGWLTVLLSAILLLPLCLAMLAVPMLAPDDAGSAVTALVLLIVLCLVQFVMGVGLLARRNWARLLMLISLLAVALWEAVDLVTMLRAPAAVALDWLPESLRTDPNVAEAIASMRLVMIAMAITIIAGSAWAYYRFTRADLRREFGA